MVCVKFHTGPALELPPKPSHCAQQFTSLKLYLLLAACMPLVGVLLKEQCLSPTTSSPYPVTGKLHSSAICRVNKLQYIIYHCVFQTEIAVIGRVPANNYSKRQNHQTITSVCNVTCHSINSN